MLVSCLVCNAYLNYTSENYRINIKNSKFSKDLSTKVYFQSHVSFDCRVVIFLQYYFKQTFIRIYDSFLVRLDEIV